MFSLVVLAIFGCLSQQAWSCTCGPKHPQSVYCDSEIVFRAKFIAKKESAENSENLMKFEVKITKIFKAPKEFEDIQFLYSGKQESMCGYQHSSTNKSEEFVVNGYITDGKVHINTCSFIKPWATLSYSQKRGFMQEYEKNCNCEIVQCFAVPCEITSENQCLWTDPLMERRSLYSGRQATKLACVSNGNGLCVWDSLKSRLYTTINKSTSQ